MSTRQLDQRPGWTRTRLTDRIGIRYPIVQGPFGGGRSTVELVAAVTNAGGLGSFGANDLEPEGIAEVARGIRALTTGPFALNLWVPLASPEPAPTEAEFKATLQLLSAAYEALGVEPPRFADIATPVGNRFQRQIEAVLAASPPVFSFIFGIPAADVLAEFRKRKIVIVGTATNVAEAIALDAAGVDVIAASGIEAGGHRASFLRPVGEALSVSALVPQLVDRVRVPVVAAGGIADGRGAVAALALGAQGVQVGTAFLATPESGASPPHKKALVEGERSTMLTRVFTGRHARGVINQMMRDLLPHEATLPGYPWHSRIMAPLTRAAAKTENRDFMALWAGQNVPLVSLRPAAKVMEFLVADIDRVLERMRALSRD